MHIQFTRITGSMLLECGWCSGAAVDAAEHARWHWRVEGRSVGDASAAGPTYGVGEPLTVAVAAAAPLASGYGGTLREEALDVLGLLLPESGTHPFPVPVHAVPQERSIGPQPWTEPVTGARRDVDPGQPLSESRGPLQEAENRAVAKYGGAATQAHVWEELRLIDAQRAAE